MTDTPTPLERVKWKLDEAMLNLKGEKPWESAWLVTCGRRALEEALEAWDELERAPKPTPAEPKCERCGDVGWTSEHDPTCMGNCEDHGRCPVQVQCDCGAPAEPMERFTKEEREALEWALSGDDPYNDKMLARLDAMLTEDRALTPEPGEETP